MRRDEFEDGLDPGLTRALRERAATPPTAPAGFTASVLARARRARAASALRSITDPMPWWVRASAEPALVLAFLLAALVLGSWAQLVEGGALLVARSLAPLGAVAALFQHPDPLVQTGLLVSFGVMGVLAAGPLYLWAMGLGRARTAPRARRAA